MVFTKTRLQKIAIIVLLAIAGILLISSLVGIDGPWKRSLKAFMTHSFNLV
jgi:hypothetical protein